MRYIKKFEYWHDNNDDLDLDKFKFKVGDLVKTTPSFDPRLYHANEDNLKGFFTIIMVDDKTSKYVIKNYKHKIWVDESDIELATEEEVAAYKYNL